MRVLDLDMDYFMDKIAHYVKDETQERLSEDEYGTSVWSEAQVRYFIETNLGMSKVKPKYGRIIKGHNEALVFWSELIKNHKLSIPFEVDHIDSHADLGLGDSSLSYINKTLLKWPVSERPFHCEHVNLSGRKVKEGIGNYLLFAIAYRWVSKLSYYSNPTGKHYDFDPCIFKNLEEPFNACMNKGNKIQLLYNENMKIPNLYPHNESERKNYIENSVLLL